MKTCKAEVRREREEGYSGYYPPPEGHNAKTSKLYIVEPCKRPATHGDYCWEKSHQAQEAK